MPNNNSQFPLKIITPFDFTNFYRWVSAVLLDRSSGLSAVEMLDVQKTEMPKPRKKEFHGRVVISQHSTVTTLLFDEWGTNRHFWLKLAVYSGNNKMISGLTQFNENKVQKTLKQWNKLLKIYYKAKMKQAKSQHGVSTNDFTQI